MEAYAQALSVAIPFFVGLIIIESIWAYFKGEKVNRPMDTISSLSSGMTFTLKQLLGLTVVIISYSWMEKRLGIFDIQWSWYAILITFVGLDFAGYWQHRFNHSFNLLWNRHIIHHSSEEFNLACALRQNISIVFQIYFFLYIPLAVIGVPTEIIATVAPIHFFAQFWYHTKLINRMGFLEFIIVTPSHHRVHHAINAEYLDKNFGEIFIFWDKLFGTFQEEMAGVPAVYGTKKPAQTWNPAIINFMHLWQLVKDAWRTSNFWDKLRIWFMPTGWRPNDVAEKYPIEIIEKAILQKKYDTSYSMIFLIWIATQFVLANVFQYYLLANIADFEIILFAICSVFIFATIFSYTSLMDGHWISLIGEGFRIVLGLVILFQFPNLPLVGSASHFLTWFFSVYLLISVGLSFYFLFFEKQAPNDSAIIPA